MAFIYFIYFAGALTIAVSLAGMILAMGRACSDCPGTEVAAPAAAATVAAGYLVIGASLVTLIAALFPIAGSPLTALFLGLGTAGLVLGLGFSNAVTVLRRVLSGRDKAPAAGPAEREEPQ